jgi:hypothetical protein
MDGLVDGALFSPAPAVGVNDLGREINGRLGAHGGECENWKRVKRRVVR